MLFPCESKSIHLPPNGSCGECDEELQKKFEELKEEFEALKASVGEPASCEDADCEGWGEQITVVATAGEKTCENGYETYPLTLNPDYTVFKDLIEQNLPPIINYNGHTYIYQETSNGEYIYSGEEGIIDVSSDTYLVTDTLCTYKATITEGPNSCYEVQLDGITYNEIMNNYNQGILPYPIDVTNINDYLPDASNMFYFSDVHISGSYGFIRYYGSPSELELKIKANSISLCIVYLPN